MKDFQFRLDSLLRLRSDREKEVAGRLAEAVRKANDAEAARAVLLELREAGHERLADLHGENGGRSAGHMQSLAFVLDRLHAHLDEANEQCREALEEVEELLDEYGEAFRDRKVIERLRQRRREEWSREKSREEQKRMDEIALSRYNRSDSRSASSPADAARDRRAEERDS